MSFRARLTATAAAAVAIAVALAAGFSFVAVRSQLRHEIDVTLQRNTQRGNLFPPDGDGGGPGPGGRGIVRGGPLRDVDTSSQLLRSDGAIIAPADAPFILPVSKADLAIAAGTSNADAIYRDATVGSNHIRMITRPIRTGLALQSGRSLDEQDRVLRKLGLLLAAVALGGVALATGLGLLVARSALKPVEDLTRAAEHVATTEDLSATIPLPQGGSQRDELARLAASFNAMLAALAASRSQQRQLVADASHELRTPLTSLRTNIEVLALTDALPEGDRRKLLADVTAQIEELSILVGDLVELAREDGPKPEDLVDVRLDEVVDRAVERARRRAPALHIETELEPWVITGAPGLLERAITNVLDNAVKWSPPGGTVVVRLHQGEIEVRDHGPGIDPADLPHVFDRFYRASSARSMPGSGLGLAIVRQVATAHGGSVAIEPADGGGTVVRLRFSVGSSAVLSHHSG